MLLWCVTDDTDGLLVVEAEEFENLFMFWTNISWNSSGFSLLEGLTECSERQALGWLVLWAFLATDRTLRHVLSSPEMLETFLTQTVATFQSDRIGEDITTDETGQILLQKGQSIRHEVSSQNHLPTKVLTRTVVMAIVASFTSKNPINVLHSFIRDVLQNLLYLYLLHPKPFFLCS